MKIKSDETPKQNRLSAWLKKHQTSDITRTIFFGTFALFSVIGLMILLMNTVQQQDMIVAEGEIKDVDNIIKYQPVIKCKQSHYLPDEYELEVKGGRNTIMISHIGRDLKGEYYLTDCNLVLSKTKDTVTENFKEALFKKRGYVSNKVAEERRVRAEALRKENESLALKLEEEAKLKEIARNKIDENTSSIPVYNNDTIRTKVASTMHTSDYYQRLEYASLYPALVRATTDLIEYKLTDEYKELKKVRFATNEKFKELNRAYNSVHGIMWRLHQKFGTKYGSYAKLELGQLTVEMRNGKLEFGYDI